MPYRQRGGKREGRDKPPIDLERPHARQQGESLNAHRAFLDFLDLGDSRSHKELLELYKNWVGTKARKKPPTKSQTMITNWSSTFSWMERVEACEDIKREQEHQNAVKIRTSRVEDTLEVDYQIGNKLHEAAEKALSSLQNFLQVGEAEVRRREYERKDGTVVIEIETVRTLKYNVTLTQISRAALVASKLRRLSLGLPTDRVDANWRKELEQEGIDSEAIFKAAVKTLLDEGESDLTEEERAYNEILFNEENSPLASRKNGPVAPPDNPDSDIIEGEVINE